MNPARNILSKSIIVTMMVLITTVFILFLVDNINKIQFGKQKVDFSSAQHSFIPDTVGGFIGVNKEWETAALQPIIYGFTTKNKMNYIQAAYLNNKNEEVYIDFVVNGEQNGKVVENIWLKEPFKEGMFITFDELKEKTEIENQIRTSYLKKIPTGSSAEHPEFDSCRTIPTMGANGVTAPIGLRLYALMQPILNGKYFPAALLPYQVYKISKDVTVYKSFPFATGVRDIALYAKSNLTS